DEDRDHDDHDDDITAEHALERFDTNNDSHLSWDEFVEMMESMDDDHDDHGDDDHGDDDHDDHGDDDHDDHDPIEEAMEEYIMDMMMSMFNESDADNDTLLSVDELENFIDSMDHLEDELDSVMTEIMISAFDEDDDGKLSMSEFVSMMESMDDDHDDHDDHGDDDHGDHGDDDHGDDDHGDDDYNETEMMELMFDMFDTNGDGFIDASELDMLMEMGEDEHDAHAGHALIHIEAEGEYGFALPHDVEFYVLMEEDGHDDHADHDDHDDHGDDGHDEEDMVCYDMSTHTVDATYTTEADCEAAGLMWTAADSGPGDDDDHGDEEDHDDHADEEALNYDPHSWLDPVAFKVQMNIVMEGLIAAFPSGEDEFRANAEDFGAELDALDDAYEAAFGENGTCVAAGNEKTVVANHNAYSYLAVRYDIQFVTVHGLDPEGEPSPEDIAKVVEHINEESVTVLFVEEYTSASAVGSIVQDTDVSIEYLYTMEMAPIDGSDDYMSLMNKNLDNLVAGIGC
ncbi:MAG: zinc ABC transporter substrate-binding protein, partial [Candidatus Thermoplasmatota archaeon]|nr:zinc ABC transporter substrate-binding protein [Candidatus Thermoplasmatota archaeon]